nr:hypothetical protein [Vulcanisaeta sp.]
YSDLKSSVDELVRVVKELSRMVDELVRTVRSHDERLARHDERIAKLEDVIREQSRTIEELSRTVKSHEERLARVEDRLARLERTVEDVKKGVSDLRKIYERLDRRLSRVERTLENITVSAEEEANIVVQYLLKQRGIVIETKPVIFNSKFEFDVYGTNGQVTIIGETKTRVGPGVVRRLVEKVDRARKKWPDRFMGKVVVVLYCLRALPGAVEEAERYGVWLIEDMKERTALRI